MFFSASSRALLIATFAVSIAACGGGDGGGAITQPGPAANVGISSSAFTFVAIGASQAVSATVTDAAGNESPQGPNLTINIDTTAPSAPSITTIPDNNGGGINGTEALDGVVVNVGLPGDAKAGDTLTVIVNGTSTSVVLTALDIGNGNAPVTIPVVSLPATDGTYPVTAKVTDCINGSHWVWKPRNGTTPKNW